MTRIKLKHNESGVTIIEATLVISLLLFIFVIGANILFFARYSSAAHWLANLAARVGSVSQPADQNGPAPSPSQLKLPNNGSTVPYLVHYAASPTGCNSNILSERHLRTINLVLGEHRRILQNKAKTVSTWIDASTVGALPEPGEMYVVPVNCDNSPANETFTSWQVCVRVPQILTGNLFICHQASAEVHTI